MKTKEEFEIIAKIAERSEKMGIGFGDRLTRLIDIEFAHEHFNLKLEQFLNGSNLDFSHDFCGIQSRIDRPNKKWTDDLFLPRFAEQG